MTTKIRAIVGAMLIAALSFAGFVTAPVLMQHHQYTAMIDQGSAACAIHCVFAAGMPSSVPLTPAALLLVIGVIIVGALLLSSSFTRTIASAYQALARPSPDLIALYAHYLD